MNKKFVSALLLGSLVFTAGTFTACSDYDDDINSLNERVDAVEKSVAELKAAIEAGSVITNVESTANGVKVTLSNGKSFELTNGKDGATGATGADGTPGSVVTIGDNGNWFIDGVDTGKPSRGEKGEQGEQGPQGPQGEQGPAGPQGPEGEQGPAGPAGGDGASASSIYYMPGENGYWVKITVDANGTKTEEETTESWAPEYPMVRVVYDSENGRLLISNAEGMAEGEVISIVTTSNLKSLAVIPYTLDKETNYPLVFFYNIMGYTSDFEGGNGTIDFSVAASTNAKAHYRLNPANANTQDWTWSMIDRVVTRADGDNKNELLSVVSTERMNDELIVTLESNKSLEDLKEGTDFGGNYFKEHAIAALQGTNKETAEVITSDYVKVTSKDLKDFSIITGYDMATEEVFELPKAGEEDTEDYKINREADVEMLYTESLDLNPLVKTWAKEVVGFNTPNIPVMVDDMVEKGDLTYEFTLPAKFELGNNKTNQQDFVTLEGSVLKVNTAKYPNGTAAIGTTPVVWVRAIINDKTITTGVMKIKIEKESVVEKPDYVVTVDPVNMEYNDIKTNVIVNKFTWEDMRQVYDALKITREEFMEHYTNYEVTDEDGTAAFGNYIDGVGLFNWSDGPQPGGDSDPVTHTNIVEMYINPTQIASDASGVIKITYTSDDKYTYAPIVIEFPYNITHKHEFFPEFNPLFVKDEIATVKGIMNNGKWEQFVEISEHFSNLDEYEAENNHSFPRLEIEPDAQRIVQLNLTSGDLRNQTLTLESPVINEYVDVPVRIVETLANGEDICVKTYTIRFINPFSLTAANVSLVAPFPGRVDEKAINLTIKAVEGNSTIATIKGNLNGNMTVSVSSNSYGVTKDDITVDLTEGTDWAKLAGLNNDGTQKLSMDENAGTIKWENKGTALTSPLNAKYKAQVRVGDFCIMVIDGTVKVTETNIPD